MTLVNLASKRFYIYEPSIRLSYKTKQVINQLINLVKTYYSSESYQALRHKLNNSKEYYLFRRYCLTRDNYRCTNCSHHATQVHHIVEVKDNPRLALNVANGISLCNDCHTLQHRWLTDGILNSVE
jgi:5-methylcytosine-specific restriction endonuclease McrA